MRYFARTGATPKETEKFLGIAKNVAGVVSSVAAFASKMFLPIQGLPEVKWSDLQKVLPKPEHLVYIIDDLERAGIEAEEVLGYINEMTEHEAAKVIILANEEEIYRINDFTKSLQKKKQNADPKETAGNARRERHERIKEKTIGLDIAYQVSVVDIYDSLIERYVKPGSLKPYIQAQKEYVVGLLVKKRGKICGRSFSPSLPVISFILWWRGRMMYGKKSITKRGRTRFAVFSEIWFLT